jgi:hypothetical protein
MSTPPANQKTADTDLVARIGPVELDVPRSLGFFGGVGLAVAMGLIDPPIGIFIAAVPFIKMLDIKRAPLPTRFVAQIFEGVAKPVGGDSQGTIRLNSPALGTSDQPVADSDG